MEREKVLRLVLSLYEELSQYDVNCDMAHKAEVNDELKAWYMGKSLAYSRAARLVLNLKRDLEGLQ